MNSITEEKEFHTIKFQRMWTKQYQKEYIDKNTHEADVQVLW